jgi:tetratricopeptide (TPR) repeat protein
MAPRWLGPLLAAPLALGLSVVNPQPARALVPYVYVPGSAQLEGSGLGIAQVAARLLRLGQVEDAARLAALTVRLLPKDPRGWVLLAEAQLRNKQLKNAATSLARAKQLDPQNGGIWLAEGSLALRDGRPKDAITLLRQGIKLDAKNAGAYFDLGNAHILLGEPTQALGAFKQAARLRSNFWEAINNQALVLFEQGQNREAIELWRQVIKIRANAAEPTLALATGLFVSGGQARREALELAGQALANDPNYVLASFQKEQLWGTKLRAATQLLLAQPELKTAVERAMANANPEGSPDDE